MVTDASNRCLSPSSSHLGASRLTDKLNVQQQLPCMYWGSGSDDGSQTFCFPLWFFIFIFFFYLFIYSCIFCCSCLRRQNVANGNTATSSWCSTWLDDDWWFNKNRRHLCKLHWYYYSTRVYSKCLQKWSPDVTEWPLSGATFTSSSGMMTCSWTYHHWSDLAKRKLQSPTLSLHMYTLTQH